MKTQVVLILAILLFTATCGGDMWFDLGRTQVKNNGDWNVITIPSAGGSGSYDWDWNYIPSGWRTYGNQLYAPKNA